MNWARSNPSPSWRRGRRAWVFLAPAGILLALFVIWPMAHAVLWSGQEVSVLHPDRARWSGLGNYSDLLSDPRFRRAFANTALFALMVVPLQTIAALFLALWVNRPEPYWRWLRAVFFVPVMVSMPVLAILWKMLYQPVRGDEMGLINAAVTTVGLPPQNWLGEPHIALPAIAFMSIWQGVGFQMMIFLAALQHLSEDQMDAARIDGAGPGSRLIHVILPGIKNSLIFAVTVTTILAFRLFAQPYLMTKGGPGDSTLSAIQWIYECTMRRGDLGRACAAALLFLIVVGLLSLIQRRATKETRA